MKIVRFTTKHSLYNGGETAGFEDAHAHSLVDSGVAVFPDETEGTEDSIEERVPATLKELIAEVKAAGYSDEAAAKIGKERLDGVYGEEAKFLGSEIEYEDLKELTPEELRFDLNANTKEQLVAFAKGELNLDLDKNLKKDEMVKAIAAEFAKGDESETK